MAGVLTTNSTIQCPDSGKVQTSSTAKLTVSNNAVLLKPDFSSWSISGCSNPTDPNSGSKTCLKTVGLTAGAAQKLTCGGSSAVLLDTLQGTSDATPPPHNMLSATAGQSKLTAV